MRTLDQHLSTTSFVVSEQPTIADFSLCGYLYFEDEIGVSFDEYPQLRRWLKEISSLPNWAHPYDLMPGHPLPSPH